ncbi:MULTISPECIES: tyrosine-type recombinase/integrase [Asticcacaulis]|uniref:tyrosine-type recombinase/integrase n=1 Tax=Asticcacaulis TaxID=76890 RepID=UPI001AE3505A|nr:MULTISPECIES: tyrosine-type recombinase/integrase [Asticcacaulis]MBP2161639.1 integrase [Asticcacaulis solisilvae]MDR6802736.1 integrase [Asticcacaulis sp. BE141]
MSNELESAQRFLFDASDLDGAFAINCMLNGDDVRAINCNIPAVVTPRQSPPSQLLDLLSNSISTATKRAYEADLADYEAFGGAIPATADKLALYLAALSETHKPATITRRLSAIGKAHRMKGWPDPTKSEIIKATVRGIRRTQGTAQQEAKPLLRDDLYEILAAMGQGAKDVRDKALLLVGFAGGFRRSELVSLDISDIEHVREGVVLTLRRSKTDQEARGRKIGIPLARGRWCPVKALENWCDLAGNLEGPIFRSINRHGHVRDRLSGEAVSLIVRERLTAIGRRSDGYSGHSLRAGFVTSAAISGVASHKIRAQTGHASDAMLERYIRDSDLFINNAAGAIL